MMEEYIQLLDMADSCVYVCDRESLELLYANQPALDFWGRKEDYHGQICHRYINGMEEPCPWCSIPRLKDGRLRVDESYFRGPGPLVPHRLAGPWTGSAGRPWRSSPSTSPMRRRSSPRNSRAGSCTSRPWTRQADGLGVRYPAQQTDHFRQSLHPGGFQEIRAGYGH